MQSGFSFPVQIISNDRSVQTQNMCCMNPQLVCSPGNRIEVNQCLIRSSFDYFPFGDSTFSMFITNQLSGSVIQIYPQRKVNRSGIFCNNAIQQSHVSFLYVAFDKLLLQMEMHFFVFRQNQNPGSGHVQAMNNQRACSIRILDFHSCVNRIFNVFPRNG
ncbi:hypothetical protein D3C80_1613310 [compost metagenome]